MHTDKPIHFQREGIHAYTLDPGALAFLDHGLTPGKWFDANVSRLKEGPGKSSGLVSAPGGKTCFVKRFYVKFFWQKALYALGRNQALRIFHLSRDMLKAGINVPAPLAVVSDIRDKPAAIYYISEALLHARTLKKTAAVIQEPSQLRSLLEKLAGIIAEMHKAGFYHGDMKWKNIMISPGPEFAVCFIDLDAAGRLGSLKDRRYAMDLSRFCVDIYESLHSQELIRPFILTYARYTGKDPARIVQDIRPYHRKRASKHKIKKNSSVPPIDFIT